MSGLLSRAIAFCFSSAIQVAISPFKPGGSHVCRVSWGFVLPLAHFLPKTIERINNAEKRQESTVSAAPSGSVVYAYESGAHQVLVAVIGPTHLATACIATYGRVVH